MTTTPTEWKRPPVIEVVLGVQFAPLEQFNNGHLGWFWREMKGEYPNATDSAPIQTIIESFGDEPEFGFPGIGFAPARGDSRLRMTSGGDGSRMIQVQNGWLVVNWMKRVGAGARMDGLRPLPRAGVSDSNRLPAGLTSLFRLPVRQPIHP